jgi:hypothetical protein
MQSELRSIHISWERADYKEAGRRNWGVHQFPPAQAQPSPGEPKAKTLPLNTWDGVIPVGMEYEGLDL